MCTQIHAQSSLEEASTQDRIEQEVVGNELVPHVTSKNTKKQLTNTLTCGVLKVTSTTQLINSTAKESYSPQSCFHSVVTVHNFIACKGILKVKRYT